MGVMMVGGVVVMMRFGLGGGKKGNGEGKGEKSKMSIRWSGLGLMGMMCVKWLVE